MFYRQRKRIPIYDSMYLDIIISDDTEKLNKITGYDDKEDYFAQVNRTTFKDKESRQNNNWKKSVTVILNPNNPGNPINAGVIVHETIHVKNFIFEQIGYRQKDNNDEAEAYLTEYIFKEIEGFFNKVMKNESNKKAADTRESAVL
jgi:hypothetical protein